MSKGGIILKPIWGICAVLLIKTEYMLFKSFCWTFVVAYSRCIKNDHLYYNLFFENLEV